MIPLETSTLYAHQRAWLEGHAFWSALLGPYGSGKTCSGILWAMKKSLQNPGCRGLWVEPTYGMIRDILLPELESYMDLLGYREAVNPKRALKGEEYTLTKSGRPELILPFSTWMLRSGEVPSRLKGPTVAWALLDEADLQAREVEDIAISRVRDPQASILAIGHVGTPETFGSWLHERVEGDARQDGDLIVRARQEDVTGLPEHYYTRMRDSYDPQTYEQYATGKWVLRADGLIYCPAFGDENIRPCPFRPGLPVLVGMDFNVTPYSFVVGHAVNGCLEIFRQYRLQGGNSRQAAETLKRDFPESTIEIWCDRAGTARHTSGLSGSDVEILRQAGLDVWFKGVYRVNDRYNATRAMSCNANGVRKLFIDPSCKQLVRELQTLTYQDAVKPGADNHSTSALDYLVYGKFNPIWKG